MDVNTVPAHLGGLTPFGAEVVKECNRLGIVVQELERQRGCGEKVEGHEHLSMVGELDALLRNVLYKGEVCQKGVVYPGEQPVIVDRALWQRVQQQLKVDTQRRIRHRKVEALLSGVLYCAQCGQPMRSTYSSRQGRRHLYYVCRKAKAGTKCDQQPVAAVDLEPSLIEQMEQSFGSHFDRTFVPRSFGRISYDSRTREVQMTLVDGSQFGYTLPRASPPGVRHSFEEQQACGRVPRV